MPPPSSGRHLPTDLTFLTAPHTGCVPALQPFSHSYLRPSAHVSLHLFIHPSKPLSILHPSLLPSTLPSSIHYLLLHSFIYPSFIHPSTLPSFIHPPFLHSSIHPSFIHPSTLPSFIHPPFLHSSIHPSFIHPSTLPSFIHPPFLHSSIHQFIHRCSSHCQNA